MSKLVVSHFFDEVHTIKLVYVLGRNPVIDYIDGGRGPYYSDQNFSQEWNYLEFVDNTMVSKTIRRKKPVGIELMFSPTMLTRRRTWVKDKPITLEGVVADYDWGPGHYLKYHHRYDSYYLFVTGITGHGSGWFVHNNPHISVTYDPDTSKVSQVHIPIPKAFNPPRTKLLLAIKSEKLNVGMMVAEMRQTQDMYVDAASKLLDVYRNIRKGKIRGMLHSGIKNAPNTWLLYRYGVTPHLSDIKALIDIATTGLQKRPIYKKFNVRHVNEDIDVQRIPYDIGRWTDEHLTGFFEQRCVYKTIVRDYAFVEFDTSSHSHNLQQLGLTNPALLAWEVIPYSFVVDWFVNVGDTLSALDALQGIKRYSSHRVNVASAIVDGPSGTVAGTQHYSRTVGGLSSSFQPPTWEPSLNWKRIVDSVALLRGSLR